MSLLFITLTMSCQSLLACKVSFEKSADSPMGAPLQKTNCFSLAAFKILSLSLTFDILSMMCLGVGIFRFILFGLLVLSRLVCLFLSASEGSSLSFSFQKVSNFLLSLFSFQHHHDANIGTLELSVEAS